MLDKSMLDRKVFMPQIETHSLHKMIRDATDIMKG